VAEALEVRFSPRLLPSVPGSRPGAWGMAVGEGAVKGAD